QAKLVHWERPPGKVLDYRRPPFARWFVGGETNLCYNALDRQLGARGDQKALVYISTETGEQRSFSYRELHLEVQRAAAMLQSLGVGKGDRVVVYMPMIPEAVFVILACARIGAIHSVVFGGFAAASLAARLDDARRGSRPGIRRIRSEEHTSELQSPYDVVCRLLLERIIRVR